MEEVNELYFDMSQVANICQIKIKGKLVGRNELFRLLRKKKVLQEGNNLPYKKYLVDRHFTVKKTEVERTGQYNRESFKTLVSQKGIELIKELLNQNKNGEN